MSPIYILLHVLLNLLHLFVTLHEKGVTNLSDDDTKLRCSLQYCHYQSQHSVLNFRNLECRLGQFLETSNAKISHFMGSQIPTLNYHQMKITRRKSVSMNDKLKSCMICCDHGWRSK